MTISGGSALGKDDIDRMVREAEQYAEEDAQRRAAVEARNQADGLVYTTEKFLGDNADKLPEDVKTEVDAAIAELRTALEGADLEAVKAKQAALSTVSQKIGEAIYASEQSASAAAPADDGTPTAANSDEDVVDAEIVDEGNPK